MSSCCLKKACLLRSVGVALRLCATCTAQFFLSFIAMRFRGKTLKCLLFHLHSQVLNRNHRLFSWETFCKLTLCNSALPCNKLYFSLLYLAPATPCWTPVCLLLGPWPKYTACLHAHAQLSQATVIARLGNWIGQLSLSQYTSTWRGLIYWPKYVSMYSMTGQMTKKGKLILKHTVYPVSIYTVYLCECGSHFNTMEATALLKMYPDFTDTPH